MKTKLFLIITLVAALTVGTALAAGPHPYTCAFGLFSPKVVAQLHLNGAQTQALANIRSQRKALFTQGRARHQAQLKALETALKSDNPDLRVLARQSDAAMEQMQKQMHQIRNAELNLYDALTPQQKAVVRTSLLKRLAFMQRHRAWRHEHSTPGTD
ncbi:MAG: Spy/CpxP family protein refolding chaperone [Gammaproteobacteria bacterium]